MKKFIKHTKPYGKQQRGMAFIEVMLAALVLVVGCVGFLKLQRIGLQSSFNDYARAQGVAISQGFIDGLRGNIRFLGVDKADRTGSIVSSAAMAATALPQTKANCKANVPETACAKAVLDYHKYVANTYMQRAVPGDGRSVLCYAESPDADLLGYMRVTFLWLDNTSSAKAALTADNCPAFNDRPAGDLLTHSVSIYAQL